jgi:signal transduction histidine kinase
MGSVILRATRFQNQINGMICLMRSQPHPWTDLDTATLTNMADRVATAIFQVLLQQRVSKQAQYQSLLRQVAIALQNSVDLPQTLQLALNQTAQVIGVEQAFILRLKYWKPLQNVRTFKGVPKARVVIDCEWYGEGLAKPPEHADDPLSQSFWVSECSLCQAAIQGTEKSLIFSAKSEFPYPTEEAGIASMFNPEEMPALMLVPLESKNRLLGFIALQQREPRVWQPEEVELVELVSAQISSAIIQTETLRQVESLVEERTAQLQQSLELQAKLYDITRKQIDKLREMNRRMDEFLSTLSHELRTPLTSMMLAIRMLQRADLTPERRQQYLDILEQQCAQETNLINDLLALQELETKQVVLQLERVELQHVIRDASKPFQQHWASKGLQLETKMPERSLFFSTDLRSLNQILAELLKNAGKYSDPNSTVFLKVTPQPGQQVQIAVCNIGMGILENEMPHIFEKFRRCQGMTDQAVPGTGLGLALVKSLVQHLNGTITASSVPIADGQSYETCFTVTLPQNLEIADR